MPYKDKEKRKQYLKEYKERNKERLADRRRELYKQNNPSTNWSIGHSDYRFCVSCDGKSDNKPLPGCIEPRHIKHYLNRKERNNEYRRRKRKEARELSIVWEKKEDPQKRRDYGKKQYDLRKEKIYSILGEKCVKCGYSDIRALQIDHVNGGGNTHRRALGWKYFKTLSEMSQDDLRKDFQILCANCNMIKKAENNEYSHSGSVTEEKDKGIQT